MGFMNNWPVFRSLRGLTLWPGIDEGRGEKYAEEHDQVLAEDDEKGAGHF